jgi:hypothetical protein
MPGRWGDLVGGLIGADPRAGTSPYDRSSRLDCGRCSGAPDAPPTPSFVSDHANAACADREQREPSWTDPLLRSRRCLIRRSNPRQRVILESPPKPVPQSGATGSAHVTRRDLARLEITADVTAPRSC